MTTKKRGRSAVTGQFVTPEYVKSHPRTTVTETIRPPKPKKRKK